MDEETRKMVFEHALKKNEKTLYDKIDDDEPLEKKKKLE